MSIVAADFVRNASLVNTYGLNSVQRSPSSRARA